jgi:hypothetical protein
MVYVPGGTLTSQRKDFGASGTAGSIDKTFLVAESWAAKSPVAVVPSCPAISVHVIGTFAP